MKLKVTGSLTNRSQQILIDGDGNLQFGAGGVKTSVQITGFTGSLWSASGSIDNADWVSLSAGNAVGADPVLLNTVPYTLVRINISGHAGNDYTLFYKQIDNTVITLSDITKTPFTNITSSAYTPTADDHIIEVNTYDGQVTVSLPTAVGLAGKEFRIKRISSGSFNAVVSASGSELIDGQNTHTIKDQWTSIDVLSNGSRWLIM